MSWVWRDGYGFMVAENEVTSSWNFWRLWAEGNWESELLDAVDRLLPDDGWLLDLGAWVGPITLWAARRPSVNVVALEPDPEAYRQLTRNIELNGWSEERVMPVQAAAALEDGKIDLWSVVGEWGKSDSSTIDGRGLCRSVAAIDIVRYVRRRRFDLVKCDIEGGEAVIFPALGPLLREQKTPVLLSTHHSTHAYPPGATEALEEEIHQWRTVEHLPAPTVSPILLLLP